MRYHRLENRDVAFTVFGAQKIPEGSATDPRFEVSWTDGPDTLGNRTSLRFKGEFALAVIGNDLFSGSSLLRD